ncbi:MAG: SapC family protein [Burkholderiaceae bacterium]|jgi:hypothetical protein|nr:SapC family protein [Burkholderiaceae bacterium]
MNADSSPVDLASAPFPLMDPVARAASGMTLFYSQLEQVAPETHAGIGLLPHRDYAFVRGVDAVPIGLGEFAAVARHYPIVFSEGPMPAPLALTGLIQGENLFVDSQDQWLDDCYVPGYIRRYPFLLQVAPDGETATLAVDPSSTRVASVSSGKDVQSLFDAQENPSPVTRQAFNFCCAMHNEQVRVALLCRALDEHDLLVRGDVRFTLTNGKAHLIHGFKVVNQAAFRALPAEVFKAWADKGWVDAIVLHLASMRTNWQALFELYKARESDKARASGKTEA